MDGRLRVLGWCACLLFAAGTGMARAACTISPDGAVHPGIRLDRCAEYLLDPTGQRDRTAITAGEWQPRESRASFGIIKGALWLRYVIDVDPAVEPEIWVLDLGNPLLEHAELLHRAPDGTLRARASGTSLPYDAREVRSPAVAFRVPVSPGRHELLLKVGGRASAHVRASLEPRMQFLQRVSAQMLREGIVIGLLAAMLLLNALLWISARQAQFGLFAAALLGLLLYRLTNDGLGPTYLWRAWRGFDPSILRFAIFATFGMLGFFVCALLGPVARQVGRGWLRLVAGLSVVTLAASLVPLAQWQPALSALVLVSTPLVAWVVLLRALRIGVREVRVLALGWTVLLVGLGGAVGQQLLGVFSDEVGLWMNDLAILVFATLSSLALFVRLDADRVAARSAIAASAAKSRFLANVSHEIRTPMHAILGFCDLTLAMPLPAEARGNVTRINDAATALLTLLNDLLDFSKLESGAMALVREPTHLAAVLEGSVALLAPVAQAKGITLAAAIDRDVPAWICGDPLRLRQLLVNLLANAVKFTDHGGVQVRVLYSRPYDGSPPRLLLQVRDSGIGMSAEAQQRLFTPFMQADDSTSRVYGGTGLGLAIVAELVQLMEGRVSVESSPGRGTTFEVVLPLVAASPPATVADPQVEPALPRPAVGTHVLVIDDTPVNLLLVRRMLEVAGYAVTTAESAREGLAVLEQHAVDCVLMDMQMPELDGIEATRLLRADPRFRDLPVIALTANALASERERCLAAGMDDFLAKPVRRDVLLAGVQRGVDTRRAARPAPARA